MERSVRLENQGHGKDKATQDGYFYQSWSVCHDVVWTPEQAEKDAQRSRVPLCRGLGLLREESV